VSSRDRKRAERRKRKQRRSTGSAGPGPAAEQAASEAEPATIGAGVNGDGPEPTDLAAEAEARGISRSELKNQRAREALEPLTEGERPRIVTAGALVSAAIALITVGAWLVGAEVDGERPDALQVFAPAILFGVMAAGMWRARYWAVLGFQAVMAILMIGAFLTLIAATTVLGALTPLLVLAVAGGFFWFTVKALARIQMPDKHLPR
jgi:hypothetical protein